MTENKKASPIRALVLITTPKLAEAAGDILAPFPLQYRFGAVGTAPSEMIDILGLGSPEKRIVITTLPRSAAPSLTKRLKKELKLGSVNSGIAFTLPISGVTKLIMQMMNPLEVDEEQRKDGALAVENKHTLIAVVVNQGYSAEVMDVAREAGAGGGTVIHGRNISNKDLAASWGMSAQEEKEVLLIVANGENKLAIMQAIGERCGMHSEAKGLVLSLPIDEVIGLEDD